jgi:Meckel syndrome type 1 protein
MKKPVTIFAIIMMLVFVAFGQQATTITPAQSPTPAPAKRPRATAPQPAIAAPVRRDSRVKGKPTTVVPVQIPVAPALAGTAVTVQAAPVTTTRIAPLPLVEGVPSTAVPTPQSAPTPNVRIATTQPARVGPTVTTPIAPAIAAQTLTGTTAPQPRIASTHPAAIPVAQQTPAPSATGSREPDFVSDKGFKGKVFEVKYREPSSLVRAFNGLGSGFKGAQITSNDEFKTITVRDFPENIAAIEEALKRLDTPQAPRPDIDFRIQVLIGSATAGQGEDVPSDLKDVVNQLQSTLKYKNYSLMVSAIHRTKAGGQGVSNNGVAESKLFNAVSVPAGNQIFYNYGMSQINLDSSTSAGSSVQIGMFEFGLRIPLVVGAPNSPIQYQNVGFRSPVSLREGEKVVVGTTTMGDKGLIVVLTAKINK